MRPIQRADRLAVKDLLAHGVVWEPGDEIAWVFELEHRLVAACGHEIVEIQAPAFVPDPVPELASVVLAGDQRALVGRGLVIVDRLERSVLRDVHRLARTLPSLEHGARWSVATAPIPRVEGYSTGEAVQQIAAGAVEAPLITVPIEDGYWPIGTANGQVVMVRRNDEF